MLHATLITHLTSFKIFEDTWKLASPYPKKLPFVVSLHILKCIPSIKLSLQKHIKSQRFLASLHLPELKPYCCGKHIELNCRRCAHKCCFPQRFNGESAASDTAPSRKESLSPSAPSHTPCVFISGREIESFNWVYRINCQSWHAVLDLAVLSWPRESSLWIKLLMALKGNSESECGVWRLLVTLGFEI